MGLASLASGYVLDKLGSHAIYRPALLRGSPSPSDTAPTRTAAPNRTAPQTTLFLHGLNGHASQFNGMIGWMKARFGNATATHSLPLFPGKQSLETPLPEQRAAVVAYLLQNAASLGIAGGKGFNLVAHSQGALLARAVIQALPPSLRVLTFVSMAGPQLGQYGMCSMSKSGLSGKLVDEMSRGAGWLAFYNAIAQDHLSVANYWNDPGHQTLFKDFSHFLPEVNGLIDNGKRAAYKAGFLRLSSAVFLGSAGDDCINPPLSSVFQFLDEHDKPTSMVASREFAQDLFGLRTMHGDGRLVVASPPGHKHMAWMEDEALFESYVLPHLA